ncbi:DNA-binding protein WhiA, partial [Gleimia europaea]|nr:DNA-binding protein WhiA [Gleimia europaea]
MSLTLALKEELVKKPVATPSEMVAEVASMLRFAGGLHLVSGRVIIEAEVDLPATAARLRTFMAKLFKVNSSVVIVSGGALKKGDRYVVRVVERADHLARMTGLIDAQGRPVRGLPTRIVASGDAEAIAAWRGAFLARGSLMEPGRSSAMEITAPGPEAALAMAGFARRMGAQAKVREIRSAQRVVVREADGIASILQALETPETLEVWQARRKRRVARGSANRLANF